MTNPFCFDEIQEGQTFKTAEFLISTEKIKQFAMEFDPQPMHLDEDAAKSGPFGRLVASGWHTLNQTMRLIVDLRPFGSHQLVGVAVDSIQFQNPVEPETTIVASARIISKRRSPKGRKGFVKMQVETRDAATDELLVTQIWTVMVPTD